jgi:hypothetical protein
VWVVACTPLQSQLNELDPTVAAGNEQHRFSAARFLEVDVDASIEHFRHFPYPILPGEGVHFFAVP